MQPTDLSLKGNVLTIEWDDGVRLDYDVAELRRKCPCATCGAERSRSRTAIDKPLDLCGEVGIREMNGVGHYASKITFSDGHDTGIYTLELLRQLGRERNP